MKSEVDKLRKKVEVVNKAMTDVEYWESELEKIDVLFNGKAFELNVYGESDDGRKDGKFIGGIKIPIMTGYKILEGYKGIATERLETGKVVLKDILMK